MPNEPTPPAIAGGMLNEITATADGTSGLCNLRAAIQARAMDTQESTGVSLAAGQFLESLDKVEFIEWVEVELKYPMPTRETKVGDRIADIAAFRDRIYGLSPEMTVKPLGGVRETDTYYGHAEQGADSVVRVRQTSPVTATARERGHETAELTWKGPKLPVASKSRPEANVSIDGSPANLLAVKRLLAGLGFHKSIQVVKDRTTHVVTFGSVNVKVMLDRVHDVGDYVELEVMALKNATHDMTAVLLSLAGRLGLKEPEMRGYAELAALARAAEVQAGK